MKKNKKLGLTTACLMLIGAMFGSAIFSLSGLTIFNAGPASLLSWFISAPIMLVYGLLVAEMASRYPKSGGVYVFPAKALKGEQGKFWAWLSCWSCILCNIAAIAFSAIFIGVYLNAAFDLSVDFSMPVAILSILIVYVLNIIKMRQTGTINNILVIFLICFIVIYVLAGVFDVGFSVDNLTPFFDQGNMGTFGFVSMIPVCIVAYSSIVSVAFMAEEIKNPNKNIAKASIIAICVVAILYLSVIFVTLCFVSSSYLGLNPDLIMIPLFAVSKYITSISWMPIALAAASVLSLITTMLILVSINARAIQAAAIDKILPKIFSKQNGNDQPIIAISVTVLISALVVVLPIDVTIIVNFGIIFNVITIMVILVSVIVSRKNSKSDKAIFVLKGGNFWPILLMIVLFACFVASLLTSDMVIVVLTTLVFLCLGIFIYVLSKAFNTKKS